MYALGVTSAGSGTGRRGRGNSDIGNRGAEVYARITTYTGSSGNSAPSVRFVPTTANLPTGADGAYCTIGGKSAMADCKELVQNAAATICVGSCSSFGGLPAAAPNPTEAKSVSEIVPGAAISQPLES
jgi:hypothetical protein